MGLTVWFLAAFVLAAVAGVVLLVGLLVLLVVVWKKDERAARIEPRDKTEGSN